MRYKVFFHFGDELTVKTKAMRGYAWLDESGLHVEGPNGCDIPSREIQHAELFRLHGLGRVIQVEFMGGRLFMSVIRFMVGQFATVNFLKTGELLKELQVVIAKNASIRTATSD